VLVRYSDRELQRLVADDSLMRRHLGASQTRKLKARIHALHSVDCAADLFPLPGRWHQLTADWAGHLSGDLDHPRRLIVRPAGPPEAPGGIDWIAITEIDVVGIFDTH
jgi:plasmid maintenance system killer protein